MALALFISHDDIGAVLTMGDAMEVVERALADQARGAAAGPIRQRMEVPGGVYRAMSGVFPAASAFGTKAGLQKFDFGPGVVKASAHLLFSSETGDLLAFLWSDLITHVRTGALGGVSARHLARADVADVAVLGSGHQARSQLAAVCVARSPQRATVFSPRPRRREHFAARMSSELGIPVRPVGHPAEAVSGADIVIAATNSSVPVFDGSWLRPGMHIISIRSSYSYDIGTGGERREIDDLTVSRAGLVAVDSIEQARHQRSPEIEPVINRTVELGAVVLGAAPGRTSHDQITLFKSFGTGLADVAVAALVHERVVAAGLGLELTPPGDG